MERKFHDFMSEEEQRIFLENNRKEMTEKLNDWKKNPEKYMTPEYTTPDGSKIAVIHDNGYVVTGVIIDSPIKVQIGLLNNFAYRELTEI